MPRPVELGSKPVVSRVGYRRFYHFRSLPACPAQLETVEIQLEQAHILAVFYIILRFCVQYEALIGAGWQAIVRYDTAHRRPHKDILHPDGTQEKQEYRGYSPAEVLSLGERDIRANWRRYRVTYEGEMKR